MAETDANPTTPPWLLLLDFLALVIKHSRLSESAAKRLVLNYYAEVRPRVRYLSQIVVLLDVDDVDTNSRKPQTLRFVAIDPRHWRDHARVDWADSSISPDDDPRWEMQLVRLHADDVFAILRWAWFREPPGDIPATPATATQQGPTPRPAKKRPRRGIARWVYDYMEAHPPRKGDHEYVGRVHDLCPDAATEKTIANLVSLYRPQFELPAEIPGKLPGK